MSTPLESMSAQAVQYRDDSESEALYLRMKDQVEEHPYRSLAIAAGVGFVLGGGLFGRTGGRLLATGLRVGLAALVAPLASELVDRIREDVESRTDWSR